MKNEVSIEGLLEDRQRECSNCGWSGDEEQDSFVMEYGWWVCGGCSESGQ